MNGANDVPRNYPEACIYQMQDIRYSMPSDKDLTMIVKGAASRYADGEELRCDGCQLYLQYGAAALYGTAYCQLERPADDKSAAED